MKVTPRLLQADLLDSPCIRQSILWGVWNLYIRLCVRAELVQTSQVNGMYISQWPSFLLSHLYSLVTPNNTRPLVLLVRSAGLPAVRMVWRRAHRHHNSLSSRVECQELLGFQTLSDRDLDTLIHWLHTNYWRKVYKTRELTRTQA